MAESQAFPSMHPYYLCRQLSVVPLELSRDSLSLYVQVSLEALLLTRDFRLTSYYAARSSLILFILQSVNAQAPDSGLTVRANFSLTVRAMQKAWSVSSAVASTSK